jgi:hypothetical protein
MGMFDAESYDVSRNYEERDHPGSTTAADADATTIPVVMEEEAMGGIGPDQILSGTPPPSNSSSSSHHSHKPLRLDQKQETAESSSSSVFPRRPSSDNMSAILDTPWTTTGGGGSGLLPSVSSISINTTTKPPYNKTSGSSHKKNKDAPAIPAADATLDETVGDSGDRVRLGICAMDKKARSKPMAEILSRLNEQHFHVVFFGDNVILHEPVENWPICDVVVAFFSKGYPLPKAKEYVALRKPFILNDLGMQEVRLLQTKR